MNWAYDPDQDWFYIWGDAWAMPAKRVPSTEFWAWLRIETFQGKVLTQKSFLEVARHAEDVAMYNAFNEDQRKVFRECQQAMNKLRTVQYGDRVRAMATFNERLEALGPVLPGGLMQCEMP